MWHKAGKSTYDAYAGLGRILARSFSFEKLLDVRLSSKGPTCGGHSYYPEMLEPMALDSEATAGAFWGQRKEFIVTATRISNNRGISILH